MSEPVLATKLHIPRLRPNLVSRPRLSERLDEGMNHELTLVVAPAGFGKTTALSTWITQSSRHVTWLSLDEGDNDPIRFWTYCAAALQGLGVIGYKAQGWIDRQKPQSQPASIEPFLTILLEEIARIPDEFAFVLEDYHVIESAEIHRNLAFLLEHLPPNMRLIVSSRADPPLPLSRLRVRNELVELRTDELRFTLEEASQFLNAAMGLTLSAENIAALEARTEDRGNGETILTGVMKDQSVLDSVLIKSAISA